MDEQAPTVNEDDDYTDENENTEGEPVTVTGQAHGDFTVVAGDDPENTQETQT